MRVFTLFFALCWLGLLPMAVPASAPRPAPGAPLARLVAWEVDGFDASLPASESQQNRLRQLAEHLRGQEADVLILRGLPDQNAAQRLVGLLRPAAYQVAHQSAFRSAPTGQGVTLLARNTPFVARSVEWRSTGQLDSPAGFVFAGFGSGTNSLCVYVGKMPDGLPDSPATAHKRDAAAQYLVHHANWLGSLLTNQTPSFCILGDFPPSTSTDTDSAARVFQQRGFKSLGPTSSQFPLWLRPAMDVDAPQVQSCKPFQNPMVIYDLGPSSDSPTVATTPANASSAESRSIIGWNRTTIGLVAGGVAVLIFGIWSVVRFSRRPTPVYTEETADSWTHSSTADAAASGGDGTGTGEAENDPNHSDLALWQARALQAEARATQANAVLRAGLLPRLNRLMRERLIAWLSSQRSQLLTSHETGTQQMLELEERLQRLQGQFHEGLQSRDQRILELEQEIQEKERMIRDLLRSQVRMADESTNP